MDTTETHPEKDRIEKATEELKKINNEMRITLNKLPLTHYRDVLRLARIAERQQELIRFSPGPAPASLTVFLENAKFTALHLRLVWLLRISQNRSLALQAPNSAGMFPVHICRLYREFLVLMLMVMMKKNS